MSSAALRLTECEGELGTKLTILVHFPSLASSALSPLLLLLLPLYVPLLCIFVVLVEGQDASGQSGVLSGMLLRGQQLEKLRLH